MPSVLHQSETKLVAMRESCGNATGGAATCHGSATVQRSLRISEPDSPIATPVSPCSFSRRPRFETQSTRIHVFDSFRLLPVRTS